MHLVAELWVTWSWICFLPMSICSVFRYITQENFKVEPGKGYFVDEVFRWLLFPGLFHYICDTINLIINLQHMSWCSFGFLLHHIITLAGAKTTLTLKYYPWFMMAPFAAHTLLLVIPQYGFLNYIYLGFIICCFYGLRREPWKHIAVYQWEFTVSMSLVCGPLIVLWLNECDNSQDSLQ
ncbi:hypothetical protein SteCoe_19761 [Stentor coeruleus]|uniref:TLC domain-containing protein n=1 Tax=Stentor coeruleus TaxID=5963 RepID=A0A1R2BTQ0_9CILI|nr:hypothetical protein SteCoe_19761 [Stentor coeruleus]